MHKHKLILATATQDLLPITASMMVEAAADGSPTQSVSAVAYTGGTLVVGGYKTPVVVDLDGLDYSRPAPLLYEHNRQRIVGQGQATRSGNQLMLAGALQGDSPDRLHIASLARDGYQWSVSVGVAPTRTEQIAAGRTVVVNGQTFIGPLAIIRAGKLIEVSFVSVPADSDAVAQVAASHFGVLDMNFSAWLKASGFDEATLSEGQLKVLKASFEAQQPDGGTLASSVDQVLASARNREGRHAAYGRIIQGAIDRGMDTDTAERLVTAAQSDNLTETDFELRVLRSTRNSGSTIVASRSSEITAEVIEASLSRTAGIAEDQLAEIYSPEVIRASERQFKHGLSLVETLMLAARRNGYRDISHRDTRALLTAAFAPVHASASGPSTYDVGGILSNVANKMILNGFMAVEQEWSKVATIGSVNDLKKHTSYSLTGDMTYELVGKQGELTHATLGEQSYENQAKTYGKIFGISEDDIINDDLGAFQRIQRMLGRGSALALNKVVWTAYLADASTFWSTAHKNKLSGASSVLSIDALSKAVTSLEKQTDPDGEPLGVMAAVLVVPSDLKVYAGQLTSDPEIRITGDGTTSVTYTTKNPHAGKFKLAASAYLNNSKIPNGSATQWFLQADPQDLPTLEVVFLNGQQSPRVEQARADFDTLGIYMRGVHRFGANKQEYRASVQGVGA